MVTFETGPTHDLARTLLPLDLRGVSFHIPGSLSPSLEILRLIPKKQTYKRALQRRYLECSCVHACILLCTRGYTVVYTRVHNCTLSISSVGLSSVLVSRCTPLRHPIR